MKKLRIAINGFGRIGRAFYRLAVQNENIEIVAINDLGDMENLRYLLQYDSVMGVYYELDAFDKAEKLHENDPTKLPWKEMSIDIVIESTGFFRQKESAMAHIYAGAKRVVISAPSSDALTVLAGVNTEDLSADKVSSNASCTTNALNPVVAVLSGLIGIEKAVLNTVHSYTSTQRTVDTVSAKDFRRGRAAAINIIPTSTGAAKATARVHSNLEGKFDGLALRVPTPAGSIIDFTFIASRKTSVDEINNALEEAANSDRWKGILAVSSDPIVSSDIIGRTEASIVDLRMTRVIDGDLVKILSWYDNETGYANMLLRHVLDAGNFV